MEPIGNTAHVVAAPRSPGRILQQRVLEFGALLHGVLGINQNSNSKNSFSKLYLMGIA